MRATLWMLVVIALVFGVLGLLLLYVKRIEDWASCVVMLIASNPGTASVVSFVFGLLLACALLWAGAP